MLRQVVLRGLLRCLEKSDGIFAFLGGSGSDDANLEHRHDLCEKCNYGAVNCMSGETLGSLLDAKGVALCLAPQTLFFPASKHFALLTIDQNPGDMGTPLFLAPATVI